MKKLFFLLVMCIAAITMQAQTTPQYVDLGLPSGTMWKTTNEAGGLYDWNSAKKNFGDKMPTREQWKELKENCKWTWTGKGYRVTGKGNSIFLPAEGFYYCDGEANQVGSYGHYWSSTSHNVFDLACELLFSSYMSGRTNDAFTCFKMSVRLVQRSEQEYVSLGLPSGTKWSSINEDGGLYNYDSAIRKFGDKIPTLRQWVELSKYCTWTWTDNGFKVTGKNGNSIFLPTTGYRCCDENVLAIDCTGRYWSSAPNGSEEAWQIGFISNYLDKYNVKRCYGSAVRLVKK